MEFGRRRKDLYCVYTEGGSVWWVPGRSSSASVAKGWMKVDQVDGLRVWEVDGRGGNGEREREDGRGRKGWKGEEMEEGERVKARGENGRRREG